ncbi:MAG: MBL fold metallo-hydrolase [Ruminococcaceae bacterium]|nr:MBL fold metallo-hydrolase [Oscillospiraceae bacterium]
MRKIKVKRVGKNRKNTKIDTRSNRIAEYSFRSVIEELKLKYVIKHIKLILLILFVLLTIFISLELPGIPTWQQMYAAVGLSTNNETELHFTPKELTVSAIDVGQGDSFFILINETSILIDTGPEGNGEKIVNYLKLYGVEELDYLIITHNHDDHNGSLRELKKRIAIKNLLIPDETINITGMTLNISGATLEFLGPISKSKNLNNMSLIIKLTYMEVSVLFTGDAEQDEELSLLRVYPSEKLKADILKVSHHGSETSSVSAFIAAVSPRIALISCGKDNEHGHPSQVTLDTLANVGAEIYRTDKDGTIVITTDGEVDDLSVYVHICNELI